MRIEALLDAVCSVYADREAFVDSNRRLTYADVATMSHLGAASLRDTGASALVTLIESSALTPVAMFAASLAGIPYVPLNYRLPPTLRAELLANHQGALIIAADEGAAHTLREWLDTVSATRPLTPELREHEDDNDVAALIYTSGTTAAPKAAVLRHRNLSEYVLSAVEFGNSADDEATLVTLPPYHIAGLMSLLSNLFSARRVVFLPRFDPKEWASAVDREAITHATVVPTMLARLVSWAESTSVPPGLASLRSLASGGAALPVPLARKVLETWPHVGLVNAYGLTETSSTIAAMDPASFRESLTSSDPVVQAHIGSVGRVLPGVELEIRDPHGNVVSPGDSGEIFLRGPQVSGEYLNRSAAGAGWFATRDLGYLDSAGYLFVRGRIDDTIIRGGENIAPATVEEVLLDAPGVEQCAVVGVPDAEWGQRIAAVVTGDVAVLDASVLRDWCRTRLRSSMTPDVIEIWPALPTTDSGKLIRREVAHRLLHHEGQ